MAQKNQTNGRKSPKVIILAAGVGSRISPLTDDCPKCLLQVAGIPILERMIVNCQTCGLSEFVIVLGYLEDRIRQFVQDRFPDLNVSFVVNDKYHHTNTGYSLLLTETAANGEGFIKFDGDVAFAPEILKRLIAMDAENAFCFDRNIKLDTEEVKVVVDANQRVLRASKSVDPKTAMGESIGIEKISAATAIQLFAELGAMMEQEKHQQDYYEAAYERLMARDVVFHAVDITTLNWVEIDTHDDFATANRMFVTPEIPTARPLGHRHLLEASSIRGFRRG
jgi:choline kinase